MGSILPKLPSYVNFGGWHLWSVPNEPPAITSQPHGPAGNGLLWQYQVTASDANGDTLSYGLNTKPAGMTIDESTGLVEWTPGTDGNYRVQVAVRDGRGGQATQTFSLEVAGNAPPQITSKPPSPALVGQAYSYPLSASDPDGGEVTLQLDAASQARGLTLSATLSTLDPQLLWTPTLVGNFPVTITADDGEGGTATQSFTLPVKAPVVSSLPPEITSQPKGPVYVNSLWSYTVTAEDPEGDDLVYSLQEPAEVAGVLEFDEPTHVLSWTPGSTAPTPFVIRVAETAHPGSYSEQRFTIAPQSARNGQPPQITSVPTGPAALGRQYVYQVVAHDPNGDALTYSLVQPVNGASLDAASGRLTFDPPTTGTIPTAVHIFG